ncbi:class I SAM-dependent methyltransferase [Allobranchiibius sp. CTAmp26]|uniref:class I SAM-dependent methyltransferase n=1 Tax=Allobranchiibius sp. CTAmp26 TaxID=2815214 RepID=UPI0027DAC348|nr:class I SAM-dependent methyltransferase [Allobranchiibius sp. CTAmp26]
MQQVKLVGLTTRGTTAPNRLRRCDRWLTGPQAWRLRTVDRPLVVDLGYGKYPVTAVELHHRLRAVRPDTHVVGVEIEAARVADALPLQRPGLSFVRGGFEIPVSGRVQVVRAFNVLRQYDEAHVEQAWSRMRERLAPDGLVVDGTCDEIGRVASWVALDADGPLSLTVSLRLADLATPSIVAERLPKALIHRNVPGERVHAFLAALDEAWERASPLSAYGPRQRYLAAARALHDAGWPLHDGPARWRMGEITVDWAAVRPGS